MFQQFSYKKKFYALAILAILLGATAYKRSFKGTLDAIEFYYHSKKDLNKNVGSGCFGWDLIQDST
ncbi:MAG: hypothetical protein CL596_05915, partial [Alteromonas sp.]|nr:hypothetical protein [Alteromonas sp.]